MICTKLKGFNMKIAYLRFILWAAVILWMVLIFSLSAQPASESSSLSGQTIRKVAEFTIPNFNNISHKQQTSIIADLQHIARKTAHTLIYLVLGVLCLSALFQYTLKIKIRLTCAIAICAGYAITDELHQLFVEGRSAQVSDVIIDSCGAMIGIILVMLMVIIYRRHYSLEV